MPQSRSRTCITNSKKKKNPHSWANTHVQTLTCRTNRRGAGGVGGGNALSGGGGGAQTILLVKQRLQNLRNVWNPEASRIFHLPKQIQSSPRVHMWNTEVVLRCHAVNTLPFFQPPPPPFSRGAHLCLYYITFNSIPSFGPIAGVEQLPPADANATLFPDFPAVHVQAWVWNSSARAGECSHARRQAAFLMPNEQLLQAGEKRGSVFFLSPSRLGLKHRAGCP